VPAAPRRPRVIPWLVLLVPIASPAWAASELEQLLLRLDATATRYAQAARSFTCDETIQWEGRHRVGRQRFGYVVVLGQDGRFEDYRTRARGRRAAASAKRVEPSDFGVPAYLRSAYLWPFVFKRERWPRHRFTIVDHGEVLERAATQIRFEPIPPFEAGVNDWFGTAWIDDETALPLRVEAHRPEDEEQLERIRRHAEGEAVSDWVYVVEVVATNFTVEAYGLRFPGDAELRNDSYDFMRGLHGWDRATRTILRVTQRYSHHRFFDVEATPLPPR